MSETADADDDLPSSSTQQERGAVRNQTSATKTVSVADFDVLDHINMFPAGRCGKVTGCIPVGFKDKDLEEAFTNHQRGKLRRMIRWRARLVLVYFVVDFTNEIYSTYDLVQLPLLQCIDLWSYILTILQVALLAFVPRRCIVKFFNAILLNLLIIMLATHRYRIAVFTGREAELEVWYETMTWTELHSDTLTVGYMSMLLIGWCASPIPCTSLAFIPVFFPAVYQLFTLTLPEEEFEGGAIRRCTVSALLCIVSSMIFVSRVSMEMHERLEFLQTQSLQYSLTKEKVLRCTAEHEAEHGPFSSSALNGQEPLESESDPHAKTSDLRSVGGLSSIVFGRPDAQHEGNSLVQMQFDAMQQMGQQEQWLIAPEDIKCYSSGAIGDGGFGSVTRGRYQSTDVAIKIPMGLTVEDRLFDLGSEVRLLRNIRHPNVVAFYGACVIPSAREFVLVEQLIDGKSLFHVFKPGCRHPESSERLQVLRGVCSALAYLHSRSPAIVHGDLKPTNVMIEARGICFHPILIDFGLSRFQKVKGEIPGGSIGWQAPEAITEESKGPACSADMYSFGRLLYFVITAQRPSGGLKPHLIKQMARERRTPELQWPAEAVALQSEFRGLCEACSHTEPDRRPEAPAVLAMLQESLLVAEAGEIDSSNSSNSSSLGGMGGKFLEKFRESVIRQRRTSKEQREGKLCI
ncbi:unnamed protein product [Polarella glacialis]|uniref:Protein kinase domain-containing protein n=1 Tax=Polarella glacialis TaxID=89957 RepID=A0A813FL05_POLGL|nr:unnamed protein product [Polarella glacialis]